MGRLYYAEQKYDEAEEIFHELARHTQDINESLIYLILIAEKKQKCDLAIEYGTRFEEMSSYDPNKYGDFSENIFIAISKCYLKKGEVEKAQNLLEKRLEKSDLEAFYKTKMILEIGKNSLELAEYEKAKEYLEKSKKNESLAKIEQIELDHLLSMALLGEKKYDNILEMTEKQDFFQGGKDSLIFAFFSSGMAEIKQNNLEEGREKMNKVFNVIVKNLNLNEFYKFYYYSFLGHYGLGQVDLKEKKYENAEKNFKNIIEISQKIPDYRYDFFIEKNNLIFLKLLAHYELAQINYNIKDDSIKAKEEINNARNIFNSLTDQEKKVIELKEIGNNGSIIEKINNLNLEINEKN